MDVAFGLLPQPLRFLNQLHQPTRPLRGVSHLCSQPRYLLPRFPQFDPQLRGRRQFLGDRGQSCRQVL